MVEQRRIEELEVAGARTGTLCLILSLKDITFLALQSTGLLKNYYREEEQHRQNKIP